MSAISRARKQRRRLFERLLKDNNGPNRKIGQWLIMDAHQIPDLIVENQKISPTFEIIQEFDFYCWNQKDWYLLRITKAKSEKYTIFKSNAHEILFYIKTLFICPLKQTLRQLQMILLKLY